MTALEIAQKMMAEDAFSQWMGIEIIEATAETCILKMVIRDEMLNGFHITHGGILFSLADSALAFICNGAGRHAVSIDTSIRTYQSTRSGEILYAIATPVQVNHKVAFYDIRVENSSRDVVAQFNGTVYRKSQEWT